VAERHPGRYEDVRTLPDANGKDRALHARRGWSQRWWGRSAEMGAPRHPKPAARKVGHARRT
jgi:hypothetical protein